MERLNEEMNFLCNGTYPAERVLVFGAVISQRDRSVHKGADIRCLLDRRLTLWKDESFDVLIQEVERCDRSLHNSYHSSSRRTDDHLVKVFTCRAMYVLQFAGLQNVLVAVC